MMFHDCSEYIYTWISRQNHVKEESLTDWLLYEITQRCDFIYYQAFSRHEEARNGCDWEWWVLTNGNQGKHRFNAYRFLVQAKKLLHNGNDNYPLISYGNKYGTQVDLLMNSARNRNALPIYMYYSIGKSDVAEQIKNVPYISSKSFMCCETCTNGCFISLANVVYDLLYKAPRRKVLDSQLLNSSFKMSILDLFFGVKSKEIDEKFELFNNRLLINNIVSGGRYSNLNINGIQHNEKSIPEYLKVFIQNKGENMNWLEKEMRITDISGLGVVDLRDKKWG